MLFVPLVFLFLVFWSYENDFTRLDELQFFAGEFLNRVGIGAEGLNVRMELLVLGFEFGNLGFDGGEFRGPGMHLERALFVEYGKQKHGDRQQTENSESDSDYNGLFHQFRFRAIALTLR